MRWGGGGGVFANERKDEYRQGGGSRAHVQTSATTTSGGGVASACAAGGGDARTYQMSPRSNAALTRMPTTSGPAPSTTSISPASIATGCISTLSRFASEGSERATKVTLETS